MTTQRPKFCAGEEVISKDKDLPGRREVTNICWVGMDSLVEAEWYEGWVYGLDSSEGEPPESDLEYPGLWVMEHLLSKVPPENRLSMDDVMDSLKILEDSF